MDRIQRQLNDARRDYERAINHGLNAETRAAQHRHSRRAQRAMQAIGRLRREMEMATFEIDDVAA